MKFFELLKRVEEEQKQNVQNAIRLQKSKAKLQKERDRVLNFAREQVNCGEITILEFSKINKQANRMFQTQLADLEEKFVTSSKYSQLYGQVANSKVHISNDMLCRLLKSSTDENWKWKVLKDNDKLKLVFVSESGKKFLGQGAIITDNESSLVLQMDYTNWFQIYVNSQQTNGHLCYNSFGNIKKPINMSMYLKQALEFYFKYLDIDLKNPENTSVDDQREWKDKEPVKTHNLYYRFMRDKKKADGKK